MTPDLVTIGGLTVDNIVAADGTVALNQAGGFQQKYGVLMHLLHMVEPAIQKPS